MRKRPMCLACLGFMLVLVLLRIAGVPLGTPFSDPKYENKAQQGRKVWIAGTIETYEKKSSNNGYVLRGEGSKGKIYLLAKRGDLSKVPFSSITSGSVTPSMEIRSASRRNS